MPIVYCPNCDREITVTASEIAAGILLECADCDTRFAVGPQRRVDADEREEDPSPSLYTPAPRRSPMVPLLLASCGILITCCGVGGVVLIGAPAKKSAAVRPLSRPAAGPTVDLDDPVFSPVVPVGIFGAFFGASLFMTGLLCVGSMVYVAVVVLLLAWVAKDCRARGVDNGAVWVLVIFLTGPIGFLVYLLARPQGGVAACGHCGNSRLLASTGCPHCGRSFL